eukprot:GHVR01185788.1.p1 GENE.GHVR01185788.1~~GHVR01185788.1.p1  ORF type:complete len:358 (-),score=94.97 GHVR01185788.1:372-1409(-)
MMRSVEEGIKPIKAYRNEEFLSSKGARHVRIMCEYIETQQRLKKNNVHCTLMIFGSARCYPKDKWLEEKEKLENNIKESKTEEEKLKYILKLKQLNKVEWMCEYYKKTYELSKRLTEWSMTDRARVAIMEVMEDVDDIVHSTDEPKRFYNDVQAPLIVCTGGGPGLMEAANRGAYDVTGGRSAGMGISLPFEPSLNPYVTPQLAFEFHYFFTRKFWMLYITLALIATPGGIGTLDELCEVLTLKQTKKVKRDIPVVLFGVEYWKNVIHFDYMVEMGTISEYDRESLFFTDSVDAAYEYIIYKLCNKEGLVINKKDNDTDYKSNNICIKKRTVTSSIDENDNQDDD